MRRGISYHYLEPSREIECHKETVEKVVLYLKEMEVAAFFAVSHYYHIPLAQLLYVGDDGSGEEWDSRNWNTQKNIRYELLRIAIEVVKKL